LEVHYAGIIVILTWKDCFREISGVDIGKRVGVSIPSTEAEIKTSNRCIMVVNHNNLLQNDEKHNTKALLGLPFRGVTRIERCL